MPDNEVMRTWPSRRLLDLLGLEIPIIQAPMAGSDSVAFAAHRVSLPEATLQTVECKVRQYR